MSDEREERAYKTRVIKPASGALFTDEELREPALALARGELTAFPTETVYGLGANALLDDSVAQIYRVKGRPQDNPLIVHLFSPDQLDSVAVEIPELAIRLFKHFSPGPLTLVLKRHPAVPARVSAGLDTVAVRFPEHPAARQLLRLSAVPVVAPSANLSGKPSPTRAEHVYRDLNGKIPFIVDGGSCTFGVESTVLDLCSEVPVILRPGAVTEEMLEAFLGFSVPSAGKLPPGSAAAPRAPGMKYRHYAPKGHVSLYTRGRDGEDAFKRFLLSEGKKAVFLSENTLKSCRQLLEESGICEIRSFDGSARDAAAQLFDAFRQFDEAGCAHILAETTSEANEGRAYMNRLRKAAAEEKPPLEAEKQHTIG